MEVTLLSHGITFRIQQYIYQKSQNQPYANQEIRNNQDTIVKQETKITDDNIVSDYQNMKTQDARRKDFKLAS